MITRRQFIGASLGGAASAVGLGLYTWQIEPEWLEVVRRPMTLAGLPASLHGSTLAQISDVHVGPRVADDYIGDVFDRVRQLAPEIVVYTGDFTSYEPDVLAHAARLYADLPRGRLGTVGILGNHDYGPGWSNYEVAQRISGILGEMGVTMLRNAVTEVSGLQIAGMDDLWAHRFDPVRTLASLDPRAPSLVLSHNPDSVDQPGWGGYDGWILAGHTHGGQCKPPFLPPPLLPVANRRYTSGEFALSGGRRLYISRGVGHLLKVRFNARPEVTLFELQAA